ncbi:rhodanese-like domain-containing protein [Mucilaginibacter sp. BT774]|uniref:rhodanese-like domain-containing protein n=1 Tax=Mucilaginibacter sp. BT774 TaxID=3062276 RepID=UPI0026751BA3|nr:rhodanese-like domain-containing protein [Mucilaginibacter sp. BT774]MDO3628350.1 thioredoxin domain-containing protein [Mucilaginibacter sp. BT774]
MKKLNIIIVIGLITTSIQAIGQQNSAKLSIDAIEERINQSKQPQIIDARSAAEFEQIHLKGAIVLNQDSAKSAEQINTLDKQKPVFVYAIGNARSAILAKRLKALGFNEVYELPGGIANWVGSGKPVEKSAKKELDLTTFHDLIAKEKLIIVEFGSKYCPGCIKMAPVADSAAAETGVKIVRIEVFDHTKLAHQLKIHAIPNIALYKDGALIWQKEGIFPKVEIAKAVKTGQAFSANLK